MKNTLILITFFVISIIINTIPKCSHYIDNQEQRKQTSLQNKVEWHVTMPPKIIFNEKIVILLEIKNISDQPIILYKDAAILLTRKPSPTVFGESVQFLNGYEKWKGFKEKIVLLQDESYTYQLQCNIEPPLFQRGIIDDLLLKYIVTKNEEIDFIEYSLDTLLIL